MDLMDMDKWAEILTHNDESEDSRAFKRYLHVKRPRLQNFVIDPNDASGAGIGTRLVFVTEKQTSDCPAVKSLIARIVSRLPDDSVSAIRNELCLTCTGCVLLHKVRDRSPVQDDDESTSSGYFSTRRSKLEFWACVDDFINAKASQPNNDWITRLLHKGVILEHHLMRGFKSSVEEQKPQGPPGSIAGSPRNAIQTEESQLADALKYAAGIYSDLSLDSDALSKLDMLDVFDLISRGLHVLWEKEVECRKDALEDE